MELPERIPFLRMVLPFVLGIALADRVGCAPWLAAALACAGLLLWRVRASGTGARAGEALLGLGLGAFAIALPLHARVPAVDRQPVVLTALESPIAAARGCRILVYVHGELPGRALLRAEGDACALVPGERALARLQLARLRPPTNPGASDTRRRWARRGVRRTATVVDGAFTILGPPARNPAAGLERARRAIGSALDPDGNPAARRSGPLLRALAIADTSRLDEPLRAVFAASGTTHLLSVSGTHVVFVVWLVQAVLSTVLRRLPWLSAVRSARGVGLAVGMASGLGYALLCGLGPPALRAAAMAFVAGLALLGGRRAAAWNALALAALAVLALDPASLFEASFQLSFIAVTGLLLWRPPAGFLRGAMHVSLAAGLATAPLAAAIGAPLPAGWLVANALAVPYFSALVVPLALAAGLLGGSPGWLLHLARAAAELGVRGLEACASPDLLAGAGDPVAFATALCALGFGLRACSLELRAIGASLLVTAALFAYIALPRANPTVPTPTLLALDVGHGDALLLRAGARAWLVDAGTRFAGFDAGRAIVRPALRAEGLQRLEALIVTHADLDHAGGAEAVLAAVPVDELWLPRAAHAAPALRALRRKAAQRGVPIRIVSAGESRITESLSLHVLWPPADFRAPSSNAGSLVIRADSADACALLTGDATAAAEREIASAIARCEVLKLAHHGSASSSDTRLLDALDAELAIASAGKRPRSPLPHPRVRARLRARSISLWETRRDGALRVVLGRPGPLVVPWLSSPARD